MNARRLWNEKEEGEATAPSNNLCQPPSDTAVLTRSASGCTALSSSTEMSTTPESPMPVLVQPFACLFDCKVFVPKSFMHEYNLPSPCPSLSL
jgi:hypothetical protein